MTRVDFINCLMPLIGDAISMDFDSGLTLAVVYYTLNTGTLMVFSKEARTAGP